MKLFFLLGIAMITLVELQAQPAAIRKWASADILQRKDLQNAHVGICILDPATGKYWLQHQDDKYFVPASTTKIFTLYAGLRLLGDSLPGLRVVAHDTALFVRGMGDPTFLHPAFFSQPVYDYLSKTEKPVWLEPALINNRRFGPGWAWDDYADSYQPELNDWPIYGNLARIRMTGNRYTIQPSFPVRQEYGAPSARREERENLFILRYLPSDNRTYQFDVPFITGNIAQLLQDTLHRPIQLSAVPASGNPTIVKSIPSDSLFTSMMHESDNFLAEQTLMMCAALHWDTIDSRKTIRYMLDSVLSDLPQLPQWEDGSGLSRYNLFTPRDFVSVLEKMYRAYPRKRLFPLFPAAGQGTLAGYYGTIPRRIYAKTGTLGGCVSLSGYLITGAGKTLIFSVMVNNHNTKAAVVRRSVEDFLLKVAR